MRGRLYRVFLLGLLGPFRNAYMLRGVGVWVCARLAMAFGGAADPALPAEVALLGIVALAVWSDARRRTEDVMLANLGVPSWVTALHALPVATLLEALVP